MIISHKHRYVFVELSHTASTAVARELCEHYDGQPILAKHSTYREFLKVANEDEKRYFVFSCVRNPMDIAVTKYFKFKTDHNERYRPDKVARRRGLGNARDHRIFRFVRESDADFAAFFLKLYRLPYNSWACLDHKRFDYVMRFERLEHDFADVLRTLGIPQVRPLPARNVTNAREANFLRYYESPEVVERAKRVFAIYMEEWGYEFPHEWGEPRITRRDRVAFAVCTFFFKQYWLHLKRLVWRNEMRRVALPSAAPGRA